jgi:hypothetical protein
MPTMPRKELSPDDVDELREHRDNIGVALAAIQAHLGGDEHPDAVFTFPRGFIRTAEDIRKRFRFIKSERLRSNIAYTVMLSDVNQWLLTQTDLSGTAKQMVMKAQIALAGSICEALLRDHLEGVPNSGYKYKSKTSTLVRDGSIDAAAKVELDWLWDTRNKIHLFEIGEREFDSYSAADQMRAVLALRMLIATLDRLHPSRLA